MSDYMMRPYLMAIFAAVFMAGIQTQAATHAAPITLTDTGFYLQGVRPFTPQYPLWSDGAEKTRWVYLPQSTQVNAKDPDFWEFPVGAKFWKLFSFNGKPVETRYIERRTSNEWTYATYLWRADQSEADLAPSEGVPGYVEFKPGIKHSIPSVQYCKSCHENRGPEVLGFSALQLSTDRDPLAPNAETLLPGSVTLKTLIDESLITNADPNLLTRPPRILAKDASTRAVLGYLHANCAHCHNPDALLAPLKLNLRHSLSTTDPLKENAWISIVGVKSRFQIPGLGYGKTYRVEAGSPETSSIFFRIDTQDAYKQMPPLGRRTADVEAVELIQKWIKDLK